MEEEDRQLFGMAEGGDCEDTGGSQEEDVMDRKEKRAR